MRTIAPLRRIACFLALLVTALGFAAEPTLISFDIPSDSAAKALKLFALQSGSEVIIRSDKDGLVKTNAVKGELTAAAALDALLKDTGLVADRHAKTGAFAIRSETETESKNVVRAVASDDRPVGKLETDVNGEKILKLDTFEVFGRKTLNMDIRRGRDDALPYSVYDQSAITRSGAANLEDFIQRRLTMSSGYTPSNYQSSFASSTLFNSGGAITSSISLRGLSSGQTLILVDGRRSAGLSLFGGSAAQPNLNGIPLTAIERIEVLPTSASAMYGGSATAGVINVVLKRSYSGAEVVATYRGSGDTDSHTRNIDLNAGWSFGNGKTQVMVSASFEDGSTLLAQDRRFQQQAYLISEANQPGSVNLATTPKLGATTNIASVGGVVLTLKATGESLGSSTTHIPYGYAGVVSDNGAALIQAAGKYNLDFAQTAGSGLTPLVYVPTKISSNLSVRHRLTSRIELLAEAGFYKTKTQSVFGPNGVSFTVSSASSANPFNQNIRITTPAFGSDQRGSQTEDDYRFLVGAIVALPGSWKAEIDYGVTRALFSGALGPYGLDTIAVTNAISSGQLAVFRDTNIYTVDFGAFESAATATAVSPYATTVEDATLRAGGSLLELPAGALTLSTLVEHRLEKYDDMYYVLGASSLLYPKQAQRTTSAYVEAQVPIIGKKTELTWIKELNLTAAGRWERVQTNGAATIGLTQANVTPDIVNRLDSTNPSIAIKITPVEDVAVRASYSRGFLAPPLSFLRAPTQPLQNSTTPDPRRGNEPIGQVTVLGGGNANLQPEHSVSKSIGIILTPRMIKGLRVSADWTQIEKHDEIRVLPLVAASLANEPYIAGLVVREPVQAGDPYGVGRITTYNARPLNFARSRVEALDLALSFQVQTSSMGSFEISTAGTRNFHLTQQTTPTAPVVEQIGFAGNLKWRANAELNWEKGPLSAGWAVRYFGARWINSNHTFSATDGSFMYPSIVLHDLHVGYQFQPKEGRCMFRVLKNTEVRLGVDNVFRTQQFSSGGAVVSPFIDPRLSVYRVTVKKAF